VENNSVDAIYEVKVPYVKDANELRPAALQFEKAGYYTAAPVGTTEYFKYWDEQLDRCINGYTTPSGDFVPGYYYFYLNFSRIVVTKIEYKDGRKFVNRVPDFPRVYDYDWAYFNTIEEAQRRGKHLVVLKSRAKGYSYKAAAMLVRNYYTVEESKSYGIAAEAEFLTKDGILTKAWEMMSFIDENTAFAKKRQKIDRQMHKRASLIVTDDYTGIKSEVGYKSEIIGITLKNDVQKIRGKRGDLFLFEEAGKFVGLKEAWTITLSSTTIGSNTFGTQIAFGTGGTEGADFESIKELFYEPDAYNILPIRNIWDEGHSDEPCGFFVPAYYNLEGEDYDGNPFMDQNGNSDVEKAIKYILAEREKVVKGASDKATIDRYVAELPMTPAEAVLAVGGNLFPKKDLQIHLANIRTSSKYKALKQVGKLEYDENDNLSWKIDPSIKDINKYYLRPGDSKIGAIVIWEHPTDNPPWGLYIIGVDPYDHDQSGTTSLGSAIVWKRFQDFETYYDMPVAEYTGRPNTADEFYENVLKLAEYYNATILFENEKVNILAYFKNRGKLHLLADQPDVINKVLKKPTIVHRTKGLHMSTPLKIQGEEWIAEWLEEEYAPGLKNLTKILSEPLIEELIVYNGKINTDRVMALMMIMFYRKELENLRVKKIKEENRTNVLFKDGIFRYNK